MEGFYATAGQRNRPIRAELRATIDDLNAFLVDPLRTVTISGKVWLRQVEYQATGTLDLLKRVGALAALEPLFNEGVMLLKTLSRSPAQARERKAAAVAMDSLLERLATQGHRYEMDYALTLHGPNGPYRFAGVKTIDGGPGVAAWTQTTTLAVALFDGAGTQFGEGAMHVHLADFLQKQLPSFAITGTNDDVRIAWAFGRFFRFFLGTLAQVYVPRIDVLDPFADRKR
jgi:hypothetical protein